jgi:hypothetical protein
MQGKIEMRLEPVTLRAMEAALRGPSTDRRSRSGTVFGCETHTADREWGSDAVAADSGQLAEQRDGNDGRRQDLVVGVREGGEVVIRVRDNGEGIPTDMLRSIFDLFVQAGGTLDRSDAAWASA